MECVALAACPPLPPEAGGERRDVAEFEALFRTHYAPLCDFVHGYVRGAHRDAAIRYPHPRRSDRPQRHASGESRAAERRVCSNRGEDSRGGRVAVLARPEDCILSRRGVLRGLIAAALTSATPTDARAQRTSGVVALDVDLDRRVGEMYPLWAYFGYDEPNYTYSWEGKKLLTELADLSPGP